MIGGEVLRERLGELARSRRHGPVGGTTEGAPGASEERESHGWRSATGCSEPEQDAEASVPGAPSVAPLTGCVPEPAAALLGRTAAPSMPAPSVAPPIGHVSVGVEAFLPGGEWRDARGAVFVHERLRSEIERPRPGWGRLASPPSEEPDLNAVHALGLEHALFLDLETGGLGSSPVFLAGTMHWNGVDFVLRQYFARHYGEEPALLRAVAHAARSFATLVTFNGKSFDVPFLRGRALVHGVDLVLPLQHLDLLHAARRRWKRDLSDCRLQTLERAICRRHRAGDVPSEDIPGLYHDFVRRGDPYRLIPVFHHNMLDVITMGEILGALCGPAGSPRIRRTPSALWPLAAT